MFSPQQQIIAAKSFVLQRHGQQGSARLAGIRGPPVELGCEEFRSAFILAVQTPPQFSRNRTKYQSIPGPGRPSWVGSGLSALDSQITKGDILSPTQAFQGKPSSELSRSG